MERLQENKDEQICLAIEKYAGYFIVEFTHFLRLHGFLKATAPLPNQAQQANTKLIQQNNFFHFQNVPAQ